MKVLVDHENKLRERAEAFNHLEGYIYATQELLEHDKVIEASTEEERERFILISMSTQS